LWNEYTGGHDFVEIGGIKWATMNVGAESITDTGLYFQWGDTQGYTASQCGSGSNKKYFDWDDYKYSNGGSDVSKYNSEDGKTVLESADDAVTAAWGGSWRMPTTEEFVALGNAVNSAWTSSYQGSGIAGLVLTDKTDSSKVLFFPVTGFCYKGTVYSVSDSGVYWSSSVRDNNFQLAYHFKFDSSDISWEYSYYRYSGFAVRGVLD
jgi:uncharacterized protein (TIGR02145 family)